LRLSEQTSWSVLCREHTPEAFFAVDMLYVDMAANGEPLKVFVDSGAQMTIMTAACAEKCHITRLIDKRYEGIAVGVGTSKIIGRIHACDLKVCRYWFHEQRYRTYPCA
jgi:DNA damage-inducible protein 1